MSGPNNPYSNGYGSQMTGTMSFGSSPAATPAGSAAGGFVKDTTTAGFTKDVLEESRRQPVLVDFWAPWCGPCKQLAPALEKVVNEAQGRVKLVKLNIDDHPSIPGQLGIQSIPAVIAFVNGRPMDGFMGAIPESQIRQFIDKIGGPAGADEAAEDRVGNTGHGREDGGGGHADGSHGVCGREWRGGGHSTFIVLEWQQMNTDKHT